MISDAGALLPGATLIAELGWYDAYLACCPPPSASGTAPPTNWGQRMAAYLSDVLDPRCCAGWLL